MNLTDTYSGLEWSSLMGSDIPAATSSYSGLEWPGLMGSDIPAATSSHDEFSFDYAILPKIQWQIRSEISHMDLIMGEPQSSDAWICLLRDGLFPIQGVETIHFTRDETTVDVWVIIPKRDIGLVRRIAEAERKIMSMFVSHQRDPLFHFDFHTVYRGSNQVEELLPRSAVSIPRA